MGCAVPATSHRLLRGQRAGGWLLFPGRPRRNLSQKATDKVKHQRGGETQLIYKPPPPSDWAGDVVIQTLNVALPFITTTSLSSVTPTTTLKQQAAANAKPSMAPRTAAATHGAQCLGHQGGAQCLGRPSVSETIQVMKRRGVVRRAHDSPNQKTPERGRKSVTEWGATPHRQRE